MDTLFELLKFILPALIVFLTAYYTIKHFLQNDQKKRLLEIRKDNQQVIMPVRLQAYERVALLLERLVPDTLINRVHKNGMSARLLQEKLLQTIRQEFDHNLSQQVYISDNAWALVKNAKEEIIKLVNIASSKVKDDAAGRELCRVILEIMMRLEKLPTQVALDYLKKEIRQVF